MSTKRYINVEQQLDNLKDSELESSNVEAIRKFIDHSAAEGISEVRQSRLITALKSLVLNFAPDEFELRGASEEELKLVIANLNRSDYADSTQHTMRAAAKKFYKVENGGREHPEKVDFFSASASQKSTVSREDIFTEEELKRLFSSFISTRDRAFTMVLYESAARPGELLARNLGDFTSNEKGDFIYLEGIKGTPDRTNQLVRSGRPLREWIAQHPLGGEVGDIEDPSVPLFVKTQQVIDELRDYADEIQDSDDRQDDLGLSDEELAFFDAISSNTDTEIEEDKLKNIAQELKQNLKDRVELDWTNRDKIRAEIKTEVKAVLRSNGLSLYKHENLVEPIVAQAEAFYGGAAA